MRETLKKLRNNHITTSSYLPQINCQVDSLHLKIHKILSKQLADNERSCYVYLIQILASIRFNENKTIQCSPFKLMYKSRVVLPVSNILQPRLPYYKLHRIGFQEQHNGYIRMKVSVSKAKKKKEEYTKNKRK